jgi:hypothetical protein
LLQGIEVLLFHTAPYTGKGLPDCYKRQHNHYALCQQVSHVFVLIQYIKALPFHKIPLPYKEEQDYYRHLHNECVTFLTTFVVVALPPGIIFLLSHTALNHHKEKPGNHKR